MVWTIRKAEFDDAPDIGRIQLENWRVAYGEYLPEEYLDDMSNVRHSAMWSEVLGQLDRIGATFVAEDEQAGIFAFADCAPEQAMDPIGSVVASKGDAEGDDMANTKIGEIGSIFVLPKWQRKGIGRGFVANVARHLAGHEFESMVVWVLDDDPARGFYEALGGDPCAQREIEFAGNSLIQVCYRWCDISQLVLIDMRDW